MSQMTDSFRPIALMDKKLLDKNGENVGKRLGIYEL